MGAPEKISLEPRSGAPVDGEIITVWIKGEKYMLTPVEAISMINQVSGILLAYEHTK